MLLDWSFENPRVLPWHIAQNPYKIWISEIMLQQTRTQQVENYYKRFIKKFPTLRKLANAHIDEVLHSWEGLGYYSRARNLYKTAQIIVEELNSQFPNTPEELNRLPGIGKYTAAAISSFAFQYPIAAVDGNVNRVLSRVFGLLLDTNSTYGKKEIQKLANLCLGNSNSSIFNQAMMDLGSQICQPKNPKCQNCPFENYCKANLEDSISSIPLKRNTIVKKDRMMHYFIIVDKKNMSLIKKREEQDIWNGLYEPMLFENKNKKFLNKDLIIKLLKVHLKSTEDLQIQECIQNLHLLTHQRLWINFYKINIKNLLALRNNSPYIVKSLKNFENFAFPRIIRKYLETKL